MDAKAHAGIQNRRKAPIKKGLDGIIEPQGCGGRSHNVAPGQHSAKTDDVGMQHVDPATASDTSGLHPEILNGGFVGHQKSAE